MTAWPNPVRLNEPITRRGLRRLSREFSTVGVDIPAARLREIARGEPATEAEWVDVKFALAATGILAEQQRGKRGRARGRWLRRFTVMGSIVVALNLLACFAFLFYLLTQHASPY